jgi:SAM-dependent methyltransferase
MSVFQNYSAYYDLLYKNKDYAGEVNYIAGLIKKTAPSVKTIIELGCGTGIHAAMLAGMGYTVHGVDLSDSMIKQAYERAGKLDKGIAEKLSFSKGDARSFRHKEKFDAVISLFHVASYQVSNEDVEAYFETASGHLNKGGVFIFDFWYGPAVLTTPPDVRVRRLENENIKVTRIAEPEHLPEENKVIVNFQINVTDKKTNAVEELAESHPMRYFFLPEMSMFLKNSGFTSWTSEEWITGEKPGLDTWGVTIIAVK